MGTNHNFDAWCSQHQMHPTKCFDDHHPEMVVINGTASAEELRAQIAKMHEERQNANNQSTP